MANEFYTGTEGVIKLGASPATIAQTSEFAVKITNIVAKQRNKADAYPTRKSVGRDCTGSFSFTFNPGEAAHVTIMEAVAAGTDLALVLYPTGAATGKKITVTVQPTNFDLPSPEPESTDPIIATVEWECNGAPVIANAA